MAEFTIKKGLDIRLAGKAESILETAPKPETVALVPKEFNSIKPRLLLKEGASVKGGEPVFINKKDPAVKFVSPVPGKIQQVVYGERRSIESIIIKPDWQGEYIDHGSKSKETIADLSYDQALAFLKESGAFTYIRQRPFDKIPLADKKPKAIFINGMDSAPNAADLAFVVKDNAEELQLGIELLKKLTAHKVYLCSAKNCQYDIFRSLTGVKQHYFSGPHPSGLVSTHIFKLDPINKGDIVWYLNVAHLAAIGSLLKTGKFAAEKTVCVSGTGAQSRKYFKTCIGAQIKSVFTNGLHTEEQRIISGTVLYGDKVSFTDYLSFYEANIQVIPEGRKRHFLGWAMPGFNFFSASSRAFASALFPKKEWNFNTNLQGQGRTIVWTDVYDQVMPLGINTNFLVKAILAEEIDEVEALGIFEVAEEDFALATYICPSKTDVCSIIRKGIETIEKEGY